MTDRTFQTKPKIPRDSAGDNFRQEIYYQINKFLSQCSNDYYTVEELAKFFHFCWTRYSLSPRRPVNVTDSTLEKYIISRLISNRLDTADWETVCTALILYLGLAHSSETIRHIRSNASTSSISSKKAKLAHTQEKEIRRKTRLVGYRDSFTFQFGVILSDGKSLLWDEASIRGPFD